MNDPQSKGVPTPENEQSKPSGSGSPESSGFGPLSNGKSALSIERETKCFTNRLKRNYAAEIAADPKAFKKRVVTCIRRGLPPFAGRPNEEAITLAIGLRKARLPWKEIYPQCITGHCGLSLAERRQAENNLRAACRSRKNARRRRGTLDASIHSKKLQT